MFAHRDRAVADHVDLGQAKLTPHKVCWPLPVTEAGRLHVQVATVTVTSDPGDSERERERESRLERERASLLGTMVHNGGSRLAPAHGLRITTRLPASPHTGGSKVDFIDSMSVTSYQGR